MHVSDLDTPALLIDLDIMERNLRRVAEYTAAHNVRLRPHTKTHKIPEIGRQQLAAGAIGLTVAKVSEAEVMMAAEPPDLLIAYPVVGRTKCERLMPIAQKTQVTVALDSLIAAQQLSEAARRAGVNIGILAEVDAGLGRVGVAPGQELLQLAQGIERLPGLNFEGIAFFPGHILPAADQGNTKLEQLGQLIQSILTDFQRAGMEVRVVSGGSTPTLFHSHKLPGLNEIRPGTYVYNDMNTVTSGECTLDNCAVSVLVTVVSTAKQGRMIVDGGSKTFSSDRLVGSQDISFGHVIEAPQSRFSNMNEEHGFVDISPGDYSFTVGDQVQIIPNHVCPAVNLHERVYGIRNDEVEQVWAVEGRGEAAIGDARSLSTFHLQLPCLPQLFDLVLLDNCSLLIQSSNLLLCVRQTLPEDLFIMLTQKRCAEGHLNFCRRQMKRRFGNGSRAQQRVGKFLEKVAGLKLRMLNGAGNIKNRSRWNPCAF